MTRAFADAGFLGSEVDYAIAEKRSKGARFSIVTLVFNDGNAERPTVPELLQPYVWKEPVDDLEALREILRAVPLELEAKWRCP